MAQRMPSAQSSETRTVNLHRQHARKDRDGGGVSLRIVTGLRWVSIGSLPSLMLSRRRRTHAPADDRRFPGRAKSTNSPRDPPKATSRRNQCRRIASKGGWLPAEAGGEPRNVYMLPCDERRICVRQGCSDFQDCEQPGASLYHPIPSSSIARPAGRGQRGQCQR